MFLRHWRRFHGTRGGCSPALPFKLADIGEGIAEVEIMQWFVKEGDTIQQFQNVCEVQSDKATVEITSRYDGTVTKLYYGVGDMAAVGTTLIDIEVDDATAQAHGTEEKSTASPPQAPPSPVPMMEEPEEEIERELQDICDAAVSRESIFREEKETEKVLTTPSVRRMAKEHQLDLNMIQGSGKDGRVLKGDVLKAINVIVTEKQQATEMETNNAAREDASTSMEPLLVHLKENQVIPIKGIKRIMVKSMNEALNIPHFGFSDEIRMDALYQLRNELRPSAESKNIKLSFMPFVLKAASLALHQYPILNASINDTETEITMFAHHHISIAMDTPRGLLVPNVKHVEQKSIMEIAQDITRLQALGTENKLGEQELTGGTFSISNIGNVGGTYLNPVILPPQVAIGAMGKMQTVPRYDEDGEVYPVRIMNISWSGDHRVIDGATMAQFSNTWKEYIENPASMLPLLR